MKFREIISGFFRNAMKHFNCADRRCYVGVGASYFIVVVMTTALIAKFGFSAFEKSAAEARLNAKRKAEWIASQAANTLERSFSEMEEIFDKAEASDIHIDATKAVTYIAKVRRPSFVNRLGVLRHDRDDRDDPWQEEIRHALLWSVPGSDSERLFLSRSFMNVEGGFWSALVGRHIRDSRGEIVATFFAFLDLQRFADWLQDVNLKDTEIVLFGRDGFLRVLVDESGATYDLDLDSTDLVKRFTAQDELSIEHVSPFDGKRHIGYVRSLRRFPLAVVATVSEEGYLSSARTAALFFGAMTVWTALLIVASIYGVIMLARSEGRREIDRRTTLLLRSLASLPEISVAIAQGRDIRPIGDPPASLTQEAFAELVRSAIAEQSINYGPQTRFVKNCARTLEFLVSTASLRQQGQSSDECIVLAVEVTDKREAENQIYRLSQLAALAEVSAGIGHELSYPVSIIQMAADNALRELEEDPSSLPSSLEHIRKSARRAARIIKNMRSLVSRRQDGLPRPLDLAIFESAELMRPVFEEAGVELTLEIEQGIASDAACAGAVEQAITNLLSNAKDACTARHQVEAPHRGRVSVGLSFDDLKKQAIVSVVDNGGGIPPDVLPRLFEPFFTTKGDQGGTGLGLSIVHSLGSGPINGKVELRAGA